ncbi:hypothetical protein FGO68_gene5305 [Halteria grandinella]|uniref:Uncharacterized protein n=1 Tax=Halteria grandinella TaxID=5974 RepID=A0A8J8NDV0_HALGN|nr:hypothetical protein FGO68_gene5305 [Halteria grandinella]
MRARSREPVNFACLNFQQFVKNHHEKPQHLLIQHFAISQLPFVANCQADCIKVLVRGLGWLPLEHFGSPFSLTRSPWKIHLFHTGCSRLPIFRNPAIFMQNSWLAEGSLSNCQAETSGMRGSAVMAE